MTDSSLANRNQQFGKNLRRILQSLNWDFPTFRRKVHIFTNLNDSRGFLLHWVNGTGIPSEDDSWELARLLGAQVSDLLPVDPIPNTTGETTPSTTHHLAHSCELEVGLERILFRPS